MTQLFDTATYDASENTVDHASASTPLPRLLHAVSAAPDPQLSAQWRLDETTIETGRRGIAMARAALRDVSRSAPAQDQASASSDLATKTPVTAESADKRTARKAA